MQGDWRAHVLAHRQRDRPRAARSEAVAHKFRIDDVVEARASMFTATPPGPYKVVRLLPPVGTSNQYRLKSHLNGHERVVREEDIFRNDN